MPSLNRQQLDEFLTDRPHILKLATQSSDGWPDVNPVWYNYDGLTFTVAGRQQARWVDNIRGNPKVGMCIDTNEAPYVRVLIRANAEIVDDNWKVPSPEKAIR